MFMLSVDGTSTIRCRCWSVGKSEGWQRHAQLKGIDNECLFWAMCDAFGSVAHQRIGLLLNYRLARTDYLA